MIKTSTDCCALCQLSGINDTTPIEKIKSYLDFQEEQALKNIQVGIGKTTGQTTVFTIISPGENKLEKNLKELGFIETFTFNRRIGYPKGHLKMMIKDLICKI